MLYYEGAKCPVCEKEMCADEDIVVCPDCGTPYHRACYREVGKCISTLHETGESWQKIREKELNEKRSEEKRAEQAEQAAERKRGDGPQLFYGELYDGVRIDPEANCAGLDPTEDHDGVSMQELSDFVGVNRFYYLPVFRLMKITGKRVTLNLSGLLFPQFYFANRKMWLHALLSMFLEIILRIPAALQYLTTGENAIHFSWLNTESSVFKTCLSITEILTPIFFILCGLFANFLYYRHSIRSIKKIRSSEKSENDIKTAMLEEGGASFGNILLALTIEIAMVTALSIILYFFR